MKAHRVRKGQQHWDDPLSDIWVRSDAAKVGLVPTPVALQPSKYIVGKWKDGEYGAVSSIRLQALHNGTEIAFRLEWACAAPATAVGDYDLFSDAAALLFPLTPDAPLFMGTSDNPVEIWHWRAEKPDVVRINRATGIGTSMLIGDGEGFVAKAIQHDGNWIIVIRRALHLPAASHSRLRFTAGATVSIALAVWQGSNVERAGLKAFSPEWQQILLEA